MSIGLNHISHLSRLIDCLLVVEFHTDRPSHTVIDVNYQRQDHSPATTSVADLLFPSSSLPVSSYESPPGGHGQHRTSSLGVSSISDTSTQGFQSRSFGTEPMVGGSPYKSSSPLEGMSIGSRHTYGTAFVGDVQQLRAVSVRRNISPFGNGSHLNGTALGGDVPLSGSIMSVSPVGLTQHGPGSPQGDPSLRTNSPVGGTTMCGSSSVLGGSTMGGSGSVLGGTTMGGSGSVLGGTTMGGSGSVLGGTTMGGSGSVLGGTTLSGSNSLGDTNIAISNLLSQIVANSSLDHTSTQTNSLRSGLSTSSGLSTPPGLAPPPGLPAPPPGLPAPPGLGPPGSPKKTTVVIPFQ